MMVFFIALGFKVVQLDLQIKGRSFPTFPSVDGHCPFRQKRVTDRQNFCGLPAPIVGMLR